jgi:hypothetical protein
MKLLNGGPRRRFPVAWRVLCVLAVVAATGGLTTPSQAAGVINHATIVERAIDALDENEYSELKALLEAHLGVVNYGAMYPDWAYAVSGGLGEAAHDTGAAKEGTIGPFRAALTAYLLPAFRENPQSEDTRKAIAFLLGVISHQEADIPFHFGNSTGMGIQPMAEQAGIPHWKFELLSDVILYDGEGVEWFLPAEALLATYESVDPNNEYNVTKLYLYAARLEQQVQYTLEKVAAVAYDLSLNLGKREHREKREAIHAFLESYRPGGLQDGADRTAEAWKQTWNWLNTYTPLTTIALSPPQPDGNDGWYRSQPVTVTLGTTDNFDRQIDTGPFVTLYSLDGGATYEQYTGPLSISSEGIHGISFSSVDSLGTSEHVQNLTLKIDLTMAKVGVDQAQTP